jgi:hypothetical protein
MCVMGALLGAGAVGNFLVTLQHLQVDAREAAAFLERTSTRPEAPPDTRWWTAYPVAANLRGSLEERTQTR